MIQQVNDRVAVAGTLLAADLGELARLGYRTVIDLRTDGEPAAGGLSPSEEEARARGLGLAYRRVPVSMQSLDDAPIAAVRTALEAATAPVLVHCSSGLRAIALALLHVCCEEGATADDALVRARTLGLDWERDWRLRGHVNFFVSYLTRHRRLGHRSRGQDDGR
jgi:uncharacterized protein (TIGR01244 family)